MPKRRDSLDGLSEDDPNYKLVRRFHLEAWADSHGLVADGLAGRISLSDFIEGCVNTFAQSAAVHVDFKDTTPIDAKCKELDRMATLHIRELKRKFAPAPKRLRKPVEAALQEFSRKVNEIAARSKQQIYKEELARSAKHQMEPDRSTPPPPGEKPASRPDWNNVSPPQPRSATAQSVGRGGPGTREYTQAGISGLSGPADGTNEERLSRFKHAHPGTTYADIKYSARVHTPDFQDWRRGKLKEDSVMSQRIEDVLSGTTPLKKKPRKRRAE